MTLSFSTDVAVAGNVTQYIQEYVASGDLFWQRQDRFSRNVFISNEQHLDDDTQYTSPWSGSTHDDNAWRYADDNPSATPIPLASTFRRVTSVSFATGVTAYDELALRDRSDLLGNVLGRGHLVDASGASLLGNWLYPTPTHFMFIGNGPSVLSSDAPTHARALIQPLVEGNNDGGTIVTYRGVGSHDANNLRMLQGGSVFDLYSGSYPLWMRQGAPVQVLLPWSVSNTSDGRIYHAGYGLPPVELSALASYLNLTGTGSTATITITLTLREYKDDFTTSDSTIATMTVTETSSSAFGGGTDIHGCELQPTDSGHSATLASDTIGFRLSVALSITGTYISYTGPTGGHYWHKAPCDLNAWGMSGRSGEQTYLPGWLYDQNA